MTQKSSVLKLYLTQERGSPSWKIKKKIKPSLLKFREAFTLKYAILG